MRYSCSIWCLTGILMFDWQTGWDFDKHASAYLSTLSNPLLLKRRNINQNPISKKVFLRIASFCLLYWSHAGRKIGKHLAFHDDEFGNNSGIDEMPKSQIEKRKRNMESASRVSRREKRNVEICFLVREENEKNREICNHFSSVEKRRRNFKHLLQFRDEKEKFCKQITWFERRARRRDFKLFVTRTTC